MLLSRVIQPRLYTFRAMSTVSQFVSAAVKADSTLAGSSDKDKTAITKLESETESLSKDLAKLNEKLTPLTYLYNNSPSSADVGLYCHLHPSIASAPASQHPSQPSVLRYFLQIQSLDPVKAAQKELPNSYPPLDVDIASLQTPPRQVIAPVKKEKKAKAPAAAAEEKSEGVVAAVSATAASAVAAVGEAVNAVKEAVVGAPADKKEAKDGGKKKEKKEKPAKAQPAKAEPVAPKPSMIDMRVGKVLEVSKHPDADSLYVEQIDLGEPTGPRTVCSGLVKYMKPEQILGQSLVIICNLKPQKMRGIESKAMLLCASSKDGKDDGGIEFVLPPAGSVPGERIYFEGFENDTPEDQLNPKKKVFETIQPDFTTTEQLEAAWVHPETKAVHKIRTKDGVCKSTTLVGASLS